ncbi:glutamate-5-semialdehyde dehydrogenase [Dysgonomonas macrotermitis]|uniref:Gamma-glutamyl phosphate reductase n=1 Tax=Dysgonomonas macrotermitis TaxID=1346286 RepID=A0A1M5DZU6_9BACT|nr:glutamate-5-semialdehyde dehydrogenase [Dysgonomonas macrotermitis]SHF72352.1 glutamate-5-semialdehyde dehydrogenase [Dysgonomonas macrotermitis]
MDDTDKLFEAAQIASKDLLLLSETQINDILEAIAKETENRIFHILSENQKDLQRMDKENPKYDRLQLTEERLQGIISDIRKVAALPYPVGRILDDRTLDNGLHLIKKTVPFGVVGVIFEARPNVSFDVFSLCFKSGNACILKGGSDAYFSNLAIIEIIRNILDENGVNPNACILLPKEREVIDELLNARKYVDLIIPRGGSSLINYVQENSRIPIIETGAGVCHTYFHKDGDRDIARKIIHNAKTRRVSVCNSLDCLIIDKDRISDLPYLCENLADSNVIIYADKQAYSVLSGNYPDKLLKEADEDSFGTEFLDYKMSVKTVNSIRDAINHISKYGSKHSEAIISEDQDAITLFEALIDAACVYVNASTAFTDGAQFGLGAEIGISTQKMHARGPMALQELCSYKWIVEGNGQIRS